LLFKVLQLFLSETKFRVKMGLNNKIYTRS
jgi:hypothetical protein